MLSEQIKSSNPKAFDVLYNRLWESMYMKAYAIIEDKSLAKDIVQEVWINLWEKRHKTEIDNIEAYLFKALRYKAYNEYRNSKRKKVLKDDYIKSNKAHTISNNIDNVINFNATQKTIYYAIEKLPKKCKEVFKLSRYDGLKNNEIAEKLNLSKRTVETHISNALKVLKNNATLSLLFLLSIFKDL